jgi:tetratricopeptide (TPR) repeat protein
MNLRSCVAPFVSVLLALCLQLSPRAETPVARQLFDEAVAAYGKGGNAQKTASAVAKLREAIQVSPDFAEAQLQLANCLRNLGQFSDAISACREYLRQNPTGAAAFATMAECHIALGLANRNDTKARFTEAALAFREQLRLTPNDARAMTRLAFCLRAYLDGLPEATELSRRAIGQQATSPGAHYELGLCLRQQAQVSNTPALLPEAIAEFRESIRLKADYAAAYVALADLLEKTDRREEAIAVCRKGVVACAKVTGTRPGLGDIYVKLARFFIAAGDFTSAQRVAADLKNADPKFSSTLDAEIARAGPAKVAGPAAASADPAKKLFDEAVALHGKGGNPGRTAEAIAKLKSALAGNPDFPAAQLQLALCHRSLGQFDEALAACREALRLKPDYPDAFDAIANCRIGLGLVHRDQAPQHFEAAVQAYRDELRLAPSNAGAWLRLANCLRVNLGKRDEAAAAYRESLRHAPTTATAHYGLGECLWPSAAPDSAARATAFDPALACYREALRIAPTYVDAHLALVDGLDRSGRRDEAITACRLAIDACKTLTGGRGVGDLYTKLGRIYLRDGDRVAAEKVNAELRVADPKHPPLLTAELSRPAGSGPPPPITVITQPKAGAPAALTSVELFNRGYTLQTKRDFAGAIVAFNQAIELDPKLVGAYVNRGAARRATGDISGATADYDRAIELDPKFAPAFLNRGNLRLGQGTFVDAITDFDRALELNPKDANACNLRGEAKVSNGDLAGAIADYTRAIELRPLFVEALNNRQTVRDMAGDWDGLIADYNHAIAENPTRGDAYRDRAKAKQAKGDWAGAVADLTKALELRTNGNAAGSTGPAEITLLIDRAAAEVGLGDKKAAIADYDRVIERAPRSFDAYAGRGQAKLFAGDRDSALSDFDRAIELNAKHAPARQGRAVVAWVKKDWAGAREDLKRTLEIDARGQTRSALFAWILQTRQGERPTADHDLSEVLATREKSPMRPNLKMVGNGALMVFFRRGYDVPDADWHATVARFLLDRMDEKEFLAAASANAGRYISAPADAAFYAGMKHSLAGDPAGATNFFRSCVGDKNPGTWEQALAVAELNALLKK